MNNIGGTERFTPSELDHSPTSIAKNLSACPARLDYIPVFGQVRAMNGWDVVIILLLAVGFGLILVGLAFVLAP
jgi:hypothetical protein